MNRAIAGVIDSGRFILGPEVEAFERELAAFLGVRHVVGVANGTDAITIALRGLGVGPGDEVIVPSFTFYASAEAIPHTGARPVFCDVDPDTFCVTAETVERALTPATKAVIAVHLFGRAAPVGDLRQLLDGRGVAILEDSAQAAGARRGGRRAGSLGDAATFSFFPSKNLFCFGDGGAIATNDDEVAEHVRTLRFHGSRDKSTFTEVGWNSRLDALQAAVLRVTLGRLDDWNARRRALAAAYEQEGLGELVDVPRTRRGRGTRPPSVRGPRRGSRCGVAGAGRRRHRRAVVLPRPGPHAARDGGMAPAARSARHDAGCGDEPRAADGPDAFP